MPTPSISHLFLIAGSGEYPLWILQEARAAGVKEISVAAFTGETSQEVADQADRVFWLRVGQLGKLLDAAQQSQAAYALMAGQIAPKNLFHLRPDLQALLLLAKLRERNAETLFGALVCALEQTGLQVLPATSFLEHHLASPGWMAGPGVKKRELQDLLWGRSLAKESSRLHFGQTLVIKQGTVLAVEAFEGTDEAIKRGGSLAQGGGWVIKVAKADHDMRFDVPVIGEKTLVTAQAAGLRGLALEAGCVLLLDRPLLCDWAQKNHLTLYGLSS